MTKMLRLFPFVTCWLTGVTSRCSWLPPSSAPATTWTSGGSARAAACPLRDQVSVRAARCRDLLRTSEARPAARTASLRTDCRATTVCPHGKFLQRASNGPLRALPSTRRGVRREGDRSDDYQAGAAAPCRCTRQRTCRTRRADSAGWKVTTSRGGADKESGEIGLLFIVIFTVVAITKYLWSAYMDLVDDNI